MGQDNPIGHLTIVSGSLRGGEALLEGTLPTSSLPTRGFGLHIDQQSAAEVYPNKARRHVREKPDR